jgi:hypothetical protein
VGNAEKEKRYAFITDISPPLSQIITDGIYDGVNLSSSASLLITSKDTISGIKSVFYSINNGEFKVFDKNIQFNKLLNGKFTVHFYAEDNVGNIELQQDQNYFYDSTPPNITISVLGDSQVEKSLYFVSSRSKVDVDATDEISGVDSIHFKIDDKETENYKNPFSLPLQSKLYTVSSFATDKVHNSSLETIQKFYVDLNPPETMHHISLQSFTNNDTLLITSKTGITLSSTDNESGVKQLLYTVNGNQESVYTDTLFFREEGYQKLEYHAIDNVNNIEETHILWIRINNKLQQAVAIAPSPHPKSWIKPCKTELVGSSMLPFFIRISASPDDTARSFLLNHTEGEDPFNFIANGDNSIKLHLTKSTKTYNVKIDALPPATQIKFSGATMHSKDNQQIYSNGLNLLLSSRDTLVNVRSGVQAIYYSINGSQFSIYHSPLQLFSREQEYVLRYYSIDSVGNMETIHTSEFTVDNTPPKTEITFKNAHLGKIISDMSQIQLSAKDNISGVKATWYFFDTGKAKMYTTALSGNEIHTLIEGDHTFHFFTVDNVGNKEKENIYTLTVDHSQPTPILKILGDKYENREIIYISNTSRIQLSAIGQSTAVDVIRFKTENASYVKYVSPFSLPQKEGSIYLNYQCLDIVGNTSKEEYQKLFMDLTTPQTQCELSGSVFSDGGKQYINAQTKIILTSKDNASGVNKVFYRINTGNFVPYIRPLNFTNSGSYDITYYAIDNVSNTESAKKMCVYVDSKTPELEISDYTIPLKNNSIIESNALIYIRANDDITGVQTITYRINGSEKKLFRQPLSNFKSGTSIDLQVIAEDRVNNTIQKQLHLKVK